MKGRGFTLVELLIGIAVIGIVLNVGLAVVASIIRSSTKSNVFNTVKQNGDLAMETMVRSVRSAVGVCHSSDMKQLLFYSRAVATCSPLPPDTPVMRFQCIEGTALVNGAIKKVENEGSAIPITNESPDDPKRGVKVLEGSCFFEASSTVPKRVTIKFTLTQGVGLTTTESQVTIPFESEVTLRNF